MIAPQPRLHVCTPHYPVTAYADHEKQRTLEASALMAGVQTAEPVRSPEEIDLQPLEPVKRKRGRPRKNPLPDPNAEPKKRGRPLGSKDTQKRLPRGAKKLMREKAAEEAGLARARADSGYGSASPQFWASSYLPPATQPTSSHSSQSSLSASFGQSSVPPALAQPYFQPSLQQPSMVPAASDASLMANPQLHPFWQAPLPSFLMGLSPEELSTVRFLGTVDTSGLPS